MATTIVPDTTQLSDFGDLLLPPTSDGRVRFSREAYHRMVEIGILTSDSRVELIEGEILMKPPIRPPQGSLISQLNDFFTNCLPKSLQCRIQLPVAIGNHSEPAPNVAIVRRRDDDYRHEHPSPVDVALVIEIVPSSLKREFERKLRLYATFGIPEYWVLDVERALVHIHRDPSGTQYRSVNHFRACSTIAPSDLPACQLDLSWLFR